MPGDPTILWFPASALVALAVIGLARVLTRRRPDSFWRRASLPAGLATGYAVGEFGVFGQPGFLPLELALRVVYFIGGAGILGVLQVIRPSRKDFRWGIRALLAGLCLLAVLRIRTTEAELGTAAVMVLLSWWALERRARVDSGWLVLVNLGLVSAGLAVCQLQSSSVVLAMRSGLLAFSVLGACLAVGRGVSEGLAYGGIGVVVAGLTALILGGIYDADLTFGPVLLLVAALWIPWLAHLPKVRNLRPWILATLQILLILLATGAAVGLTIAGRPPAQQEDEAALYRSL